MDLMRRLGRPRVERRQPAPLQNTEASLEQAPDGLTNSQRERLLVAFRNGIGSRPAMTEDLASRFDSMADKLAGNGRVVTPRR